VPDDCLIDADGAPTNDPTGYIRDHTGALKAFGLHKGSGLAVMCEIMATAVAGGQAAHDQAKGGVLNSMLAILIDLAKIGDPAAVIASVGATRAHVKSARPTAGVTEVLTPGEPERLSAARRNAAGIEIDETSWSDIRAAALKLGITEAEFEKASRSNA
jgi:hydroxycarboxylate dehydrogenase B